MDENTGYENTGSGGRDGSDAVCALDERRGENRLLSLKIRRLREADQRIRWRFRKSETVMSTEESLLTGEHIRYMQGYPDGTFDADGNMTRAEAAQMFFNLLNENLRRIRFTADVKSSAWYADAVGALSELGIVEGYEDGSFRPDDEISRAEFVAMISRFFRDRSGARM